MQYWISGIRKNYWPETGGRISGQISIRYNPTYNHHKKLFFFKIVTVLMI